MVPAKKHPLEVFRRLGDSNPRVQETWRRGPPKRFPRKTRTPRPGTPVPEVDQAERDQVDGAAKSPGDFRVVLTLNQVLVSLLVVTVLCLGGYFLGYYRGAAPNEAALAQERPAPRLIEDPADTAGAVQAREERYGVIIATYDEGKEDLIKRTRDFLIEKGFDRKVIFNVFYETNRKHAIIVGSFDRKDHPDLVQLLRKFQAINDFPGKDAAPFKSAFIYKHPDALKSQYGD